jgi:hypothetical protein
MNHIPVISKYEGSKSVPAKFTMHRVFFLTAIFVTTSAAFAQSVVSTQASSMSKTAIATTSLPAGPILLNRRGVIAKTGLRARRPQFRVLATHGDRPRIGDVIFF